MNSPVSYISGLSTMDDFELQLRVRNRIFATMPEEDNDDEWSFDNEPILI